MKPFHIFLFVLLGGTSVSAQQQGEPTLITYTLDEGNLDATHYNSEYFSPEPLHAHNVIMEDTVFNGLDGVFSNGWGEGVEYDTTQYLHLRVNINPGYILHLDSVSFAGTGTSWYGPIVCGVRIYDADTACGYTVGWQICDSVLRCVSSMWHTYDVWDQYPYTWHDTTVNWWQINSRTHIDLHFYAWGNVPDTLGNYMASTGWVVDNIQLHGKVTPDLSTSVDPNESSKLPPVIIQYGSLVLGLESFGTTVTVSDMMGKTLFHQLVRGGENIKLPTNQMVLVTQERDGRVRTDKVIVAE